MLAASKNNLLVSFAKAEIKLGLCFNSTALATVTAKNQQMSKILLSIIIRGEKVNSFALISDFVDNTFLGFGRALIDIAVYHARIEVAAQGRWIR